jgi:hypothetical protein
VARWGSWPASGHEPNDSTVVNGELDKVLLKVYGDWTDGLKAAFSIPNPSREDYLPWQTTAPLNVLMQSSDSGEFYGSSLLCVGKSVLYAVE